MAASPAPPGTASRVLPAKLEGLYVKLDSGNKNVTVYDLFGVPYNLTAKSDNGGGVVRVGINYKF